MLELNITFENIEKRMRNFVLDDSVDDVVELVSLESSLLEAVLCQIGISDPSTVTTTSNIKLYQACRYIVMLRVTSEIYQDFSHEYGDVAKRRAERADMIEKRIVDTPEAFIDNWDEHKHMGGWGYSDDDEDINMKELCTIIGVPWENMIGG